MAPPVFSLGQIVQQLRTQWGGSWEGTTESWAGTGAINYYIGGTPYASGSGEAAYKTTMTSLMQSRATLAFELWDDLIARDLNQVSTAAFGQIQFEYTSRTYDSNGNLSTAGGTYSGPWASGGGTGPYGTANYNITRDEIWLNSNWTSHNADNDMYFGGYGFQTYMHEIGHSLGLSHPGTYDAGSGGAITYASNAEYSLDNRQYTIMSYFGGYAPGVGWQQDGTYSNWLYSSTPMLDDVAAIQAIYGADMTTRTGNTTYGFNSNTGRDVFDFSIDTAPIVTIWDAGGIDTLDVSAYSANQRIDLRAGTYSDIGGMVNNVAIAYNVTIENAIGGSGNDTITGNEADNVLRGNGGNDTIDGGAGTDTAVFSGLRSSYTLTTLAGNGVCVAGPDGTDVLSNIERLQFDDQTVSWPSIPDLVARDFVLVGTTASYGIFDIGSGPAGSSTAGIYLSTDSTITTSDTLLATNATSGLAAGTGNVGPLSLTLPSNLTPGTYYIGVIADYTAQVAEGDESNNVSNVIAVILGNNSGNTINGTSTADTIFGFGGNDTFNGGAGADILTGGTGSDHFVFDGVALSNAQSGIFDRITDYDQSGGSFNTGEGDQIDLSAILSAAYNHGSGQSVASLLRAVAAGTGASLQIDADGAANSVNWVTIARLDGVHAGDSLNVVIDSSQPAGATISIQSALVSDDFSGDAKADVLFQHDNGAPKVWLMNGPGISTNGAQLASPTSVWHEKATGDFNGDGKADILWQNDNGMPAVWLMDGTADAFRGAGLANPGPTWHAQAAADFNGDGKADILWHNESGGSAIWLMNGTADAFRGAAFANPGAGWHAVTAADFNGDGKADILWQNDDGTPMVWLMDGTTYAVRGAALANPGPSWHAMAAADFNGDGKADILWQNDNGTPAVWLMDGTNDSYRGPMLANPGASWHIKAAEDFNGDGKADILWQNANGTPAVWLMDGAADVFRGPGLDNLGSAWHIV